MKCQIILVYLLSEKPLYKELIALIRMII